MIATHDDIAALEVRIKSLEEDQIIAAESARYCHEAIERRLSALENTRGLSLTVSGSLLQRMQQTLASNDDPADCYWNEARAAVRVVAQWLNEQPLDVYAVDRAVMVNALLDEANQ